MGTCVFAAAAAAPTALLSTPLTHPALPNGCSATCAQRRPLELSAAALHACISLLKRPLPSLPFHQSNHATPPNHMQPPAPVEGRVLPVHPTATPAALVGTTTPALPLTHNATVVALLCRGFSSCHRSAGAVFASFRSLPHPQLGGRLQPSSLTTGTTLYMSPNPSAFCRASSSRSWG